MTENIPLKDRSESGIAKSIRLRGQLIKDSHRSGKENAKIVDNPIPVDDNYTCRMVFARMTQTYTMFRRKDIGLKGRQILREIKFISDLLPDGVKEVEITIKFLKGQ